MAYISKVTLPGNTTPYDIKDTSAWTAIGNLWSQMGHSLVIEKVESLDKLPTASANTTGKIYLVPDASAGNNGGKDIYDEYITVQGGSTSAPTYSWEVIGNTDVELGKYSLKTHTHSVDVSIGVNNHSYTPTGTVNSSFSGASTTFTGSFTPSGSVSKPTFSGTGVRLVTGDISVPTSAAFAGTEATISVTGTAAGSASGTIDSSGDHTHSITKTTKYLHTTSGIPKTFSTQSVVTGLTSNKLVTASIAGVSGSTTASKATAGTAVSLATPGTEKSFSKISSNSVGTVSVTLNTAKRATGELGTESSTRLGTNQVLYDASVNGETLYFTMKTMNTSDTATTVKSASTDATVTSFENSSITGINGSTSITPYTFADVTVPVAASAITVATGTISASGTGSSVVIGSSTAKVLKSVDTSVALFSSIDNTSTNGTAIITEINSNTDTAGAHTHGIDITFTGGSVTSTGKYTPAGNIKFTNTNKNTTVSAATSGTATYTPEGTVSKPDFTGTDSSVSVSGTPNGSVTSSFKGDDSTITHTVTGNGSRNTSAANQ